MTLRVWLAFVALCLIWGIPYFFIKKAGLELSPVWIAWGRLAFGALLLLPIAWKRGALQTVRKHWVAIVCFATVELVAPFYLIALGERWVSSALAGILLAAVPLMVVIIAPLVGVIEHLGRRRILGLAAGLIGVIALLGLDSVHGASEWIGAGCILLATVGYATGPLIIQRHLAEADSLGVVAASVATGAILLAVPAAFTAPPAVPSPSTMLYVAILGLVCTALGLLLFVFVVSRAGASRASVVTYVNPAVAVLLGVIFLGERFGVGAGVGLVLILFGSWLATSVRKAAH